MTYLKYSGIRKNIAERRLNTTGRIGRKSGVNKLPLQSVSGITGAFEVAIKLLSGPGAAGGFAYEGENSHCRWLI
ncbi:hypothetical protein Hanom_Chr10g00906691 [Helianthus anomalus]